MALENILEITDSAELERVQEQISKKKAVWLFESGRLDELTPGSFEALSEIHRVLFGEIYDFAGSIRTVNIAHPFREGNGRSMRIWLDLMFKKEIQQVIDWSKVDKDDYLMAMERSPIKDIEIKYVLRNALTDLIDDRDMYMKGIDHSYYYEGYNIYKVKEL